jgi:hypothetical protein
MRRATDQFRQGRHSLAQRPSTSLRAGFQRWVTHAMNQSAVGTTDRIPSAVPTGLGVLHHAFPALNPDYS